MVAITQLKAEDFRNIFNIKLHKDDRGISEAEKRFSQSKSRNQRDAKITGR